MATQTSSVAVGDKATAATVNNLIANEVIIDSGTVTITPSAANTPTSQAVTFNKTFPSAPKIMLTANTSVGPVVSALGYTGASTTGFTAWLTCTNTTARVVAWMAVLSK